MLRDAPAIETTHKNEPSFPSVSMASAIPNPHHPYINTTDISSCRNDDSGCTPIVTNETKATSEGQVHVHDLLENCHNKNTYPHKHNPSRPPTLYGRTMQQHQLLEAYHASQNKTNPQTVVAIIKGSAGSGKTALIDSLQASLVKTSVISWTCDRQNRLRIGSGLMVGMQKWVQSLLLWNPNDLSLWRQKVLQALEPLELAMLFPLIRPLFQTNQLEPDSAAATAAAAADAAVDQEYRFGRSTFQKFLRVASSWEFPMIFVLDDFQWVEDALFRQIFERMNTAHNEGSFFIFSYNTDFEDTQSSWFRELQDIQAKGFHVVEIVLENLNDIETLSLVSDALGGKDEFIDSVSRWIHKHSLGNPLYVLELIRGLFANNILSYGTGVGSCTFQEDAALSLCGDCSTVCEYLTIMLKTLSEPLLNVLKVAACLGFRFDSKLVSSAMSGSVDSYLHLAEQANIVQFLQNFGESDLNLSQHQQKDSQVSNDWQFVHNSMQEAILRTVGNHVQQEQLHLAIGRKLLMNLSSSELKKDLLTVTGQIMKGSGFIKDKERSRFAHLALEAAHKAVNLGSFESAKISISFAVSLTHERSWRDDYDLTLAIHNAAAEVAYANGDFDDVEQSVAKVLLGGRTFDDRLQANMTEMYALGSANRIPESLALGLHLLKGLGEALPANPRVFHVLLSMLKTRLLLRGKSDNALLQLPNMSAPRAVSAMQIMNILLSGAFWYKPLFVPMLATKMVQLSLKHGLCAASSVAFAMYGMVLVSHASTRQEGVRMGNLGLMILDRFKTKAWVPRVYAVVYGLIQGWTQPLHLAFEPLLRGYTIGLETGDIEVRALLCSFHVNTISYICAKFATINITLVFHLSLESGKPLKQIHKDYDRYVTDALVAHHQKNTVMAMNSSFVSCVRMLMGETIESEISPISGELHWAHVPKVRMAAVFCDYKQAAMLGQVFLERVPTELYDLASVYMFVGIANIALFKATGKRQQRKCNTARLCLRKIKCISTSAIEYCLGKVALLQAELSSISSRRHANTVSKYLTAISWAATSNNLFEGAMAHERFGRYLNERGELLKALTHLRTACSLYDEWNAFRKVEMLQEEIEVLAASLPTSLPCSNESN